MHQRTVDLSNIFKEYEDQALSKARAEIAVEDAAWNALPQAERDRINAERESRFQDIPDSEDEDEDEEG